MIICPLLVIGYASIDWNTIKAAGKKKTYNVAEEANCITLCAWYDKENKQCSILSIAKYLDRLHSSTIKRG